MRVMSRVDMIRLWTPYTTGNASHPGTTPISVIQASVYRLFICKTYATRDFGLYCFVSKTIDMAQEVHIDRTHTVVYYTNIYIYIYIFSNPIYLNAALGYITLCGC